MPEAETNYIREQCYIVLGNRDVNFTITIKINSFPVNAAPWDIYFFIPFQPLSFLFLC